MVQSNLLVALAHDAEREQQWAEARSLLQEAVRLRRAIDYKSGVAFLYGDLGNVARGEGNYELAIQHFQRSLAGLRKLGRPAFWWSRILPDLGHAYLLLGQIQRARDQFKDALQIGQEIGYELLICRSLIGFAHLAVAQGVAEQAARLWGAGEAQMELLGQRLSPADRMVRDHFLELARQQGDEGRFEREWAAGRVMPVDEAAAYALRTAATVQKD
jgi:tetratricopeptide (TPR) repeat protein